MDIQPIANQISTCASKVYQVGKTGVLACGHVAKVGYSRYAIPAAEKLSAVAAVLFNLLQKLVQTGPGIIFALAGTLLLAGITAFKLADRKAYEEDRLAKTAWKTVGIMAFISATAMTSVGMFAILTL